MIVIDGVQIGLKPPQLKRIRDACVCRSGEQKGPFVCALPPSQAPWPFCWQRSHVITECLRSSHRKPGQEGCRRKWSERPAQELLGWQFSFCQHLADTRRSPEVPCFLTLLAHDFRDRQQLLPKRSPTLSISNIGFEWNKSQSTRSLKGFAF